MIRKLTYKLISIAIAIVFFMITTGFNLYVHWCACEDSIKTSVIASPGCGDSHTTCGLQSYDNNTEEYHDLSCGCKSEVIKVKLEDSDFFKSYLNVEFKYFSVLVQIIASDNHQLIENHLSLVSYYNPEESPPILPSGKSIIIYYHQFKTPESVA